MDPSPTIVPADEAPSLPQRRKLGYWHLLGVVFFCTSGGPYGLEEVMSLVPPLGVLGAFVLAALLWGIPSALITDWNRRRYLLR